MYPKNEQAQFQKVLSRPHRHYVRQGVSHRSGTVTCSSTVPVPCQTPCKRVYPKNELLSSKKVQKHTLTHIHLSSRIRWRRHRRAPAPGHPAAPSPRLARPLACSHPRRPRARYAMHRLLLLGIRPLQVCERYSQPRLASRVVLSGGSSLATCSVVGLGP